MAGPGSDRCGVGVGHSFAELREVASEECPTGIGELGVKRASTADPLSLCHVTRRQPVRSTLLFSSSQTQFPEPVRFTAYDLKRSTA